MRQWRLLVFLFSFIAGMNGSAQTKSVAERLGYPANTKLLIIHADDLAVAHSVDSASFDALDRGAVTSASIMVPCPWLTEVAEYAKAHPDADLGLHLVLNSEWKTYRWGPVESKDKVPSLLDPAGTLWSTSEQVTKNVKPEEAEREIRAQVEHALAVGIHPTHLDTHMGSLMLNPQLISAYAKVAHENHLPFLFLKIPGMDQQVLSALNDKDIVLDAIAIANPSVNPSEWEQFYLDTIRNLKPGLTELIVHLGHDDAELKAIMGGLPYGSEWRQRDFNAVTSPEFKKALQDNHVVLVKWKDLQKLVQ
jgi:predicted glycoside hydrolase/deacetylase ChbG (UPF0249 family)